jgi:hypothetical protein
MPTLDHTSEATLRRHPGRLWLLLGLLAVVAGPVLYAFQLRAKVLTTPWYLPLLTTAGLALVLAAWVQRRSLWRWAAVGLCALLAAGEWAMILFLSVTPAYNGPVQAGQPFPEFATTLADGATFTQQNLKGDKNSVMVFFRGRW